MSENAATKKKRITIERLHICNCQYREQIGKDMLGINTIKLVALLDPVALHAETSVPTFLFRHKIVSVSQAATVDKLLAPLSGFVVEEARKISLAKSRVWGKTATASRALKIEKETKSLLFSSAILYPACRWASVSKNSTNGEMRAIDLRV